MNRRIFLTSNVLALSSLAVLSGCSTAVIEDYANEKPELKLPTYFNGLVDAWGIFTDTSGKVVKRFTVEMQCSWQDNQGTFVEDFLYSDGTKQQRIWKLNDLGNGAITGTAGDVVGTAQGQSMGNAFHWNYTLALPVSSYVINVQMDDWMYLMGNDILLNKTRMSKLGIHLGDVTISFRKRA